MTDRLTFESVFGDEPYSTLPPSDSKETDSPKKQESAEAAFLKKTPLSILEEGSKISYQQTAGWEARETPMTSGPPEFTMILQLRGIRAEGVGNTKKSAKHKAAVAYLHEIVNKGHKQDFFIPGATDEESHGFIDSIAEKCDETAKRVAPTVDNKELMENDEDKSIPTAWFIPKEDADKNWIGKLQERAQKYRMDAPQYEDVVLENNNFMFTCTMCKQKTRGISGTKKVAKTNAAYMMAKLLDNNTEALQGQSNFGEFMEIMEANEEETKEIAEASEKAFAEPDPKLALETLLSDTARFDNYTMEFRHPSVNGLGTHQVLLEIIITRPVSPEDELQMGAEHTQTAEIIQAAAEKEKERTRKLVPDVGPRVFSGFGKSEEESQLSAYRAALIHFNTYGLDQTD